MIPLDNDLLEMLKELAECQGCIGDDQYDAADREKLNKLQKSGLVLLGWVLTNAGKKRIEKSIK